MKSKSNSRYPSGRYGRARSSRGDSIRAPICAQERPNPIGNGDIPLLGPLDERPGHKLPQARGGPRGAPEARSDHDLLEASHRTQRRHARRAQGHRRRRARRDEQGRAAGSQRP